MSYPIYEVKPNSHIYRVASSLSREQCHDMVEFFDDQDDLHYDGITGGGYDTDVKITRDIAFEQLPAKGGIYKEIDDMLYNSLADGLAQLKELLTPDEKINPIGGDFLRDYGYMFSCYPAGGYYQWHHDGGDVQNRQLTALWYLNDIPKEAGGRTLFRDQDIQIQPKAGDLILFPANWTHVHKAEELKFGKKYIATTWIL